MILPSDGAKPMGRSSAIWSGGSPSPCYRTGHWIRLERGYRLTILIAVKFGLREKEAAILHAIGKMVGLQADKLDAILFVGKQKLVQHAHDVRPMEQGLADTQPL